MSRLLVIVADQLSALVAKGEVIPRYYNPQNLFDEVHLLSISEDTIDAAKIQPMVGDARVFLHFLSATRALFVKTLGWRLPLVARWAEAGVALATRIEPDLIRCHGNSLNGFVAARIKRSLRVPLVVSLHINPEDDLRRLYRWRREGLKRLGLQFHRKIERAVLADADAVVCVYPYLVDYARRWGARRIEVIYNVVQQEKVVGKGDYRLHAPPRVVNVGRQIAQKDPSVLLRAAAAIPDLHVTLIGDGPLHARLRVLTRELDIASRTTFIPALANDEICRTLAGFDVFVSINEFGGVSKAVLEGMSAGLPLLANRRTAATEPLVAGCGMFVGNSAEEFREALVALLGDETRRKEFGERARQAALRVSSAVMEQKVADLYQSLLDPAGVSRV